MTSLLIRPADAINESNETAASQIAFLRLLHDVTVAANQSSQVQHAAQICLNRICSQTAWPAGRVHLRARRSNELTASASAWPAGDGFHLTSFRPDLEPLSSGKGELAKRVMASRKAEFLIHTPRQTPEFPCKETASRVELQAAAAFPIFVGDEVMGILEFFSFDAAEPDQKFLTLVSHTATQLGQVIARQQAAEDLRHAKLLAEHANQAKSEFLAVMSHEIRTPMHAILGIAELLAESSLSPKQHEYVQVFQRAGTKLIELINSILDLSKVESGRLELDSVPFELGSVLDRAIELMSPLAQARGLELTCEVAPNIARSFFGDPDRLRQVLLNLIGNAIKFTERGSVSVRVERGSDRESGSLRFSVTDTGIGVSAEHREMIFHNFTQADSSTTRRYGGTGLGLAICKSLVELMGGQIGLKSEPGSGSTFFFTIRLGLRDDSWPSGDGGRSEAEPSPRTQPHSPPQEGEWPAVRILIAEDSEDNLYLIDSYLKGSGFIFDLVRNGKQAVEAVMSGNYDCVLMDVQMPVMDGHSAVSAIRAWERAQGRLEIPIVALTAHAFRDVIEKSKQAGCTDHLTKPIQRRALLEAISRYIRPVPSATPVTSATAPEQISPAREEKAPHATNAALPDEVQDLVPGYIERRQTDITALWAALKMGDYETLSTLGHQLKGSGIAFGFDELSDRGASLEQAAKANDLDEASRQTALIADYVAQLANA